MRKGADLTDVIMDILKAAAITIIGFIVIRGLIQALS